MKIVKVIVNCEANNDFELEMKTFGESPYYLGYDFYVHQNDETEIVNFIIDTLKKYNQPLIYISSKEMKCESCVEIWTREEIEQEIARGYKQ